MNLVNPGVRWPLWEGLGLCQRRRGRSSAQAWGGFVQSPHGVRSGDCAAEASVFPGLSVGSLALS